MNKKKHYYNNLQKYRIYYGMTQLELANKLGISIQTIRLTEQFKTHPTGHNAKKMIDCFNVSYDQMFIKIKGDSNVKLFRQTRTSKAKVNS